MSEEVFEVLREAARGAATSWHHGSEALKLPSPIGGEYRPLPIVGTRRRDTFRFYITTTLLALTLLFTVLTWVSQ